MTKIIPGETIVQPGRVPKALLTGDDACRGGGVGVWVFGFLGFVGCRLRLFHDFLQPDRERATIITNVGLQDVRVCKHDAAMHPLLWRSQRFPKPFACRSKLHRSARFCRPPQFRDPIVCPPHLLMLGAASGRHQIYRNLRRGASAARPQPRCGFPALRAPGRAAAAAPSAAPGPGLRRSLPLETLRLSSPSLSYHSKGSCAYVLGVSTYKMSKHPALGLDQSSERLFETRLTGAMAKAS